MIKDLYQRVIFFGEQIGIVVSTIALLIVLGNIISHVLFGISFYISIILAFGTTILSCLIFFVKILDIRVINKTLVVARLDLSKLEVKIISKDSKLCKSWKISDYWSEANYDVYQTYLIILKECNNYLKNLKS